LANPTDGAGEPTPQQSKIESGKTAINWRGYLREYAIIVIGVLTALGAQQAADWLHDRQRAAQARDGIRSEIATGLGHIASRDALEACVSRRLDEVDALITQAVAGRLPPGPIWIGRPYFYAPEDSQYKTAIQSGAVNLLPNDEQNAYATIYNAFDHYAQSEKAEQAAWGDLRVLEKHPAASPGLEWQLRSALQRARTSRWEIEAGGRAIAKPRGAQLGITPVPTWKFTIQSACIPLHTERKVAEEMVVNGRTPRVVYDEP
jgi:hypothetical protein